MAPGGTRILGMMAVLGLASIGCDADDTIPEGCERLFDRGSFACPGSSDDDDCPELLQQGDRVLGWIVQFREDLDDDDERIACVQEHLDRSNVTVTTGPIEGDFFGVTATVDQLDRLCRTSMIDDCHAYGLTEDCAAQSADACDADPFCWSYRGNRLQSEQGCRASDEFAVCLSTDQVCTAAGTTYRDPDGACWYFSGGCLSEFFSDWQSEPDCPSFDEMETFPTCG